MARGATGGACPALGAFHRLSGPPEARGRGLAPLGSSGRLRGLNTMMGGIAHCVRALRRHVGSSRSNQPPVPLGHRRKGASTRGRTLARASRRWLRSRRAFHPVGGNPGVKVGPEEAQVASEAQVRQASGACCLVDPRRSNSQVLGRFLRRQNLLGRTLHNPTVRGGRRSAPGFRSRRIPAPRARLRDSVPAAVPAGGRCVA
jgi:hypothetical protein